MDVRHIHKYRITISATFLLFGSLATIVTTIAARIIVVANHVNALVSGPLSHCCNSISLSR